MLGDLWMATSLSLGYRCIILATFPFRMSSRSSVCSSFSLIRKWKAFSLYHQQLLKPWATKKLWPLPVPILQPVTCSLYLSHRGGCRCSASAPTKTPHWHVFANFFYFLGTSILAAHLLNYLYCWTHKNIEDVTDGALRWIDVIDAECQHTYLDPILTFTSNPPVYCWWWAKLCSAGAEIHMKLSISFLSCASCPPPTSLYLASQCFCNDFCSIFKNYSTSFKMWHKQWGFDKLSNKKNIFNILYFSIKLHKLVIIEVQLSLYS